MWPRHRTKIIATMGPACDNPVILEDMFKAGLDLVRLNFSHGDHTTLNNYVTMVRDIARKLQREIGIVADLQGPKIRIGKFVNGKVTLVAGQAFTLDNDINTLGDNTRVAIDFPDLFADIHPGDTLLLNDGFISLTVTKKVDQKLFCTVVNSGVLGDHKGINKKGGGLSAPALTNKDIHDLHAACAMGVDYIAVSFVRDVGDISQARQLINQASSQAGIIAKIERHEAIDNITAIIRAADAVMVARGDLGVEIGDAAVPSVQKHIIQLARSLDKAVITATHMMESMIKQPMPTRAEVSDVANAVLDGTDAVMLSAETAVGEHPVAVIAAMQRVCHSAERNPLASVSRHRLECTFKNVDEAIAMATMYTANHLKIKAIIALTESGATTMWMSRIRSGIPIFGLTRHVLSARRMTLYRGVFPLLFDPTKVEHEAINREAVNLLVQKGLVTHDDLVIITKGHFMGILGGTNTMKIIRVGDLFMAENE